MLDIPDLEARWLRYKIKSYIPHSIILISLIVIITTGIIVINSTEQKENSVPQTEIKMQKPMSVTSKIEEPAQDRAKVKESKVNEKIEIKEVVTTPEQVKQTQTFQNTNKRVLAPSMNFMKEMQNSALPYYNTCTRKQAQPEKTDTVEEVIEEVILDNGTQSQELEEETITQKEESKKIKIKRQNTQNDIASILKRFKKNNNPALSLFVAKKYYELGDYQNAYNYALITNEINIDIE